MGGFFHKYRRMPRGSDDEYDDQDLVSDDEEQGEEDEVDYTYNELMTAVSKSTVFLREKYAAEGEEGLPGTRDELGTMIEPHTTIQRTISLNLAFAFLATIGILAVKPRGSEEDPVESLPVDEEDQIGQIVEAVVQRQVISFSPQWKSLCNNPVTFDKLREIPKLDQQLVIENMLRQLNEENEKENMKMDTRTILYHLVDLCKQEHKIASDEVIDYYLSKNLLTITREKSDSNKVIYSVEYDEKLLQEPKKAGMNFWMILLLLVILSPPLLKKFLGLTFS